MNISNLHPVRVLIGPSHPAQGQSASNPHPPSHFSEHFDQMCPIGFDGLETEPSDEPAGPRLGGESHMGPFIVLCRDPAELHVGVSSSTIIPFHSSGSHLLRCCSPPQWRRCPEASGTPSSPPLMAGLLGPTEGQRVINDHR